MELLQLQYFKAVADTEHISNAAKHLHIAQPSLSQTIKRLESELGMPLFDRTGKHIILNDAGKIFLKYVNQVFSSLDNAVLELNTYAEITNNTVNICFQSASTFLPEILKQITREYPNIHFRIFQHQDDIDSTEMDLTIFSDLVRRPSDSEQLLLSENLVVVLPVNHPLTKADTLSLSDLKDETFISLSKNSNLYQIISHYCKENNFEPNVSMFVENPNTMRDLLRLNLGIALVPELTWNSFVKDTIVMKPISDSQMNRCLYISWNPTKYLTPSVLICRDKIIDYFTRYSRQDQL